MSNTSQHIVQILETIQSFQIVQCQMHHEKVALNVEGNPIHNSLDETLVFDRVNLCDKTLRNKRLGCAHSGANLNFERVLDDLKTIVPHCERQISEFKKEFKTVVAKIYTIDHKVGHLEHDIALCKLNNSCGKDTLDNNLHFLQTEHKELMHLLFGIRTDIEQLVKTEINYTPI